MPTLTPAATVMKTRGIVEPPLPHRRSRAPFLGREVKPAPAQFPARAWPRARSPISDIRPRQVSSPRERHLSAPSQSRSQDDGGNLPKRPISRPDAYANSPSIERLVSSRFSSPNSEASAPSPSATTTRTRFPCRYHPPQQKRCALLRSCGFLTRRYRLFSPFWTARTVPDCRKW